MFIKTGRLLAVAAITLTAIPAFAQDLRYAHVGAEGDIQTRYAAEAAEEIAAATDGAVTDSAATDSAVTDGDANPGSADADPLQATDTTEGGAHGR